VIHASAPEALDTQVSGIAPTIGPQGVPMPPTTGMAMSRTITGRSKNVPFT
jgi:hypothetical protein